MFSTTLTSPVYDFGQQCFGRNSSEPLCCTTGFVQCKSEDWSAFDALPTSPDAFPMLRRVSITIEWFARLDGDEKNALKTSKDPFWALLESAEIEFAFSVLYVERWHATVSI